MPEEESPPSIIHADRIKILQKNIRLARSKRKNKDPPDLYADMEQLVGRYMESMRISLGKVPDDADVQVLEHLIKEESLSTEEASAIEDLIIASTDRPKKITPKTTVAGAAEEEEPNAKPTAQEVEENPMAAMSAFPNGMPMMFPFFVPYCPPRAADPQEFAEGTSDDHKEIFKKLEKRLTRSVVVRPCGLHLTHKEAYQSAQHHYNETGASLLGGNATYKSYMYVVGSQRRFRVAKAGKEGNMYWYVSEPRDNWQQVIRSAEYDNGFAPLPAMPAMPEGMEMPPMPAPNGEPMSPGAFASMMSNMMTNMMGTGEEETKETTDQAVETLAEAVAEEVAEEVESVRKDKKARKLPLVGAPSPGRKKRRK